MAKNYLISVLLKLIDGLTTPLIAMNKTVKAQMLALSTSMVTMGKALTTFLTIPILAVGAAAVITAGQFEKQRVAIETLLGSVERAGVLLSDLEEFSARTPFQLPGLIDVAKRLLAFGFAAEEVLDVTKRLGDAAMGDAVALDSIANAFGKVRARGKATMRELNMFIFAGVPILDALSEALDTTTEGVLELSAKGGITFEMVNEALNKLTTGTGQFAGMTEKMALTLPGLFSTMVDNIGLMGKAFGEEMAPMIKEMLRGITDLTKWLKSLDSSTKSMIISVLGLVAALGPLLFIGGKLIKFFLTGLTPINLMVMAIGALVIGIIALNEAFKKSRIQHKLNADAVQEETEDTRLLKDEYIVLQEKTELNNEEKQRMVNIEQILTRRIGDTAFALNEQTGELELNLEAWENYGRERTQIQIRLLEAQLLVDEALFESQQSTFEGIQAEIKEGMGTLWAYSAAELEILQRHATVQGLQADITRARILDTKQEIAALMDLLAGITKETEDAADAMEDFYDTGEGTEEDIPLLSIPTKVKEKLENLQALTQNIGNDLSGDIDINAPDNIITDLVGRIEALNQSTVDVNIRIEHDEDITAKIISYESTGNANVNIDINSLLGNILSEVTP